MGHMKDLDRRIRQGGDDAIAAVGELVPRWISVDERLPNGNRIVLGFGGGYALPSIAESQHGCLVWCHRPNIASRANVPTHWMPLPEPPEVK